MKLKRSKYVIIVTHRIKECIMLIRYYKFSFRKKPQQQLYVSLFDNRRIGFGLADRLKGIISLYALSKIKQVDYRCSFTYPFDLSLFLVPNQYDWKLKENELLNNSADVKIVITQGEDEGWKRLIRLNTKKQLQVYLNRDYLDAFNKQYNTTFEWGELFHELFRPSAQLEQEIILHLTGKQPYIACHLRFMSLLGDFKEYEMPPLKREQQEELIKKCGAEILKLKEKYNKPVFVFSDSETFLNHMLKHEGIYALPDKIVHIDCIDDKSTDIHMKPFVDFGTIPNFV